MGAPRTTVPIEVLCAIEDALEALGSVNGASLASDLFDKIEVARKALLASVNRPCIGCVDGHGLGTGDHYDKHACRVRYYSEHLRKRTEAGAGNDELAMIRQQLARARNTGD